MGENKPGEIIRGAVWLTISTIIVKVIGLLFKIPLSYILTEEGMAYFNSAYTVYTFFYIIATAGVPKAISILVAKNESERENDNGRSIYTTAIITFSVLGIILTLVFFFGAPFISRLIGSQGSIYTMMAIAPSILFVSVQGVIRGYFNGKLMLFPIALSEIVSSVGKLALGLAFAYIAYRANLDLTVISAFAILGLTLGAFIGLIYLVIYKNIHNSKENTRQKISKTNFSTSTFKKILTISIPLTLTSGIGALSGVIDLALIMNRLKALGYTELQSDILYGNYTTLVVPMLNLVATLIGPISAILLPLISRDGGDSKNTDRKKKVDMAIKTVSFVAVPISFVFFISAYDVLSIIFENSSANLGAPLLMVCAPGILFMSIQTIINTTLEALERTTLPLYSLITSTVIKLILTYIFMGNESIGVLGAPLATTVSYFVGFLISTFLIKRVAGIGVNIFKTVVFPIIISIFSSLPVIIINTKTELSGLAFSILRLCIFAFIYLAVSSLSVYVSRKRSNNLSNYPKKR